MTALYEHNIAKFQSKLPNERLVGSKRSHEDSEDSSLDEGVPKSKKFNLIKSKTKNKELKKI